MALSREQRQQKLLEAKTPKNFYDLYEEVFEEEFPVLETLDPNEKIEMLINAIENNKRIKGYRLTDNVEI